MKRLATLICALGMVLYLGNVATYAQTTDRAPTVNRVPVQRDTDRRDVPRRDTDRRDVPRADRTDVPQRDTNRDVPRRDTRPASDARPDLNGRDRDFSPVLRERVAHLLPPDVDIHNAISGFKNADQFLAALHVSKNLNIPFLALKEKLVGPNPVSLGQAIQQLKPDLPEAAIRKEIDKATKESIAMRKATDKAADAK